MGITQKDLADSIHVPYQRINEIINIALRREISPKQSLNHNSGNSPAAG
jgi:plasmid maintenance system antidote protein VapI